LDTSLKKPVHRFYDLWEAYGPAVAGFVTEELTLATDIPLERKILDWHHFVAFG
jgi:hypothetical protein